MPRKRLKRFGAILVMKKISVVMKVELNRMSQRVKTKVISLLMPLYRAKKMLSKIPNKAVMMKNFYCAQSVTNLVEFTMATYECKCCLCSDQILLLNVLVQTVSLIVFSVHNTSPKHSKFC